VEQQNLFRPVPIERLALQTKEDLILFIKLQQEVNDSLQRRVDQLEALQVEKKQKVQLPSLRYPDAPLIERTIEFQAMPKCSCCGSDMKDSGMTEDSEFLTVIPKQYLVIRQKRQKVRCGKCHGSIQTAPAPERIKEGSSFSDEISNWYLWGFSNSKTSLFEYHDTRSGDVASKLLNSSKCEYLISDVFSGYGKAVRDSNVRRQEGGAAADSKCLLPCTCQKKIQRG